MFDTPAIYIDDATYLSLKTSNDPFKVLSNAIAVPTTPRETHPRDPGSVLADSRQLRSRAIIVNALDGSIEGREVADIHGSWVGQPTVPDAGGNALRLPSGTKNGNGTVGTDWIDGIGSGMASVGVWTFDQGAFTLFHGVSYVVRVSITDYDTDLMLSLIASPQGFCGIGADLYSAGGSAPPTTDDYYSSHDGQTATPGPLVHKDLNVTIRREGLNLFALIDNITPTPAVAAQSAQTEAPPPDIHRLPGHYERQGGRIVYKVDGSRSPG